MNTPLRLLAIALQFLTRLPITLREPPNEREMGRSLLCYPLIGLLIGGLLGACALLGQGHLPSLPTAALLLVLWVVLSGGLHLDGLADSADAWAGSRGEAARALAIMKDPNCGPLGVVALLLVLLLKFSALAALIGEATPQSLTPLLIAPLLGRTALLPLFMTTDYVRPNGLGSAMHAHLPRHAAGWLVALILILLVLGFGEHAVAPCLAALLALLVSRRLMRRVIGGMTGDTAGATVEIVETAALLGGLWV
jgi:adenosylcobinamide-GDP ribazoletransferase